MADAGLFLKTSMEKKLYMAGKKKETKPMEAVSQFWMNIILAAVIVILIAVIALFIYFGLELSSTEPVESSEAERLEWMHLLSGQEFRIDKAAKNSKLEELLYIEIDSVVFDIYDTSSDYLVCSFFNDDITGCVAEGYITNGDESLLCDTGGPYLEVWLEMSEDEAMICLIMQGRKERLILNPLQPSHFRFSIPGA